MPFANGKRPGGLILAVVTLALTVNLAAGDQSLRPWSLAQSEQDTAMEMMDIGSGEKKFKIKIFKSKKAAPPSSAARAALPNVPLFGTMEFGASLSALPNWLRVLGKAEQQISEMNACSSKEQSCPPSALSWQQILKQARGLSPVEQLREVNTFFNRYPYRLDSDVHGVSDFWATPQEFLKRSGDCEDYSIAKYYALKSLGFSPSKMRIVVVMDTIRNIAHAVLAVYIGQDVYILDNMSNLLFKQERFPHYVPQYSVNEYSRWMHIQTESGSAGNSIPQNP